MQRRRPEPGSLLDLDPVLDQTTIQSFPRVRVTALDGRARLYRINLLQGRASIVGAFAPRNQVTGMASKLDQR